MGTSAHPHRLLLIGGGHCHLEVLRRFARSPEPQAELTLVSPEARMAYSGMLPGTIAGHYAPEAMTIALAPLAQRAQARFVQDRVQALGPDARIATLASGCRLSFDTASIDVGSIPDMSVPGAGEHAIGAKPIFAFLAAWNDLLAASRSGRIASMAVVGAGAGGIELALAMQYRLQRELGPRAPALSLISERLNLPPAASRQLATLLQRRNVALHLGSAATRVDAGVVALESGATIRADGVIWATAAAALPWLAASGLACDAHGFVRVNRHLQSVSHPRIFAAGDCAGQDDSPRPKSGALAVRQGPLLAANLRSVMRNAPLAAFRPPPPYTTLALIATGERHALAVRGPFVLGGRWIWRLKDRIDRRYVARYRP